MEKTKKHFLRRAALLLAMLTLASAVMVGCGGKKEPEKDPKDDEVIVKPEPVVLPEGVSFDEKKYPDVFGFMQVPNASQCAISKGHYLAQSPKSAKSETGYDDDYYLNRDLDGVTNKAGSLYIQAHYNKADLSDPVTVIYGHNMANRSMFGGLQSYAETLKFNDNAILYIYQPDRKVTYRIFAGIPMIPATSCTITISRMRRCSTISSRRWARRRTIPSTRATPTRMPFTAQRAA